MPDDPDTLDRFVDAQDGIRVIGQAGDGIEAERLAKAPWVAWEVARSIPTF